jgi:hypothetical protein
MEPTYAPTAQPGSAGSPAAATVRRGCHRISPYQAGFEDTHYDREYQNPFTPGTREWHYYEQGNEDARLGERVLL